MRIIEVPEEWRDSLRIVTDVTSEDVERFLTARERSDLESLKLPVRRIERAASRIAGKLLLEETRRVSDPSEIEFLKRGDRPEASVRGSLAPYSISFTHSSGLGAAAAGDLPVGVDLETFREIRLEMTRFFLSADELASACDLAIEHALLHFWSAKEAAFKLTGEFATLLKVPLAISGASASGLTFDVRGTAAVVETRIVDETFVVALAQRLAG